MNYLIIKYDFNFYCSFWMQKREVDFKFLCYAVTKIKIKMRNHTRFKKDVRNIYVLRSSDRSIGPISVPRRRNHRGPSDFCEASRLVSDLRYGEEASFEKRFTRPGRIEECTSCLESPGKQHKRNETKRRRRRRRWHGSPALS